MTLQSHIALPIAAQSPTDPLSQYALALLKKRPAESPVDDVLREMEEIAAVENIPIIGPLEGAIIQSLVRFKQMKTGKVLDIGTAIGYSAIWLAHGLAEGSQVYSIEIDPVRAARARTFIARAGFSHRVQILVGDVMELLPGFGLQFDIILQDVIKHLYFGSDSGLAIKLLHLCQAHLVDGGMLLGDNAFCLGEVLHEANGLPGQVAGIQAYNQALARHKQLESVIIPVRDGLWLSHKKPSVAS